MKHIQLWVFCLDLISKRATKTISWKFYQDHPFYHHLCRRFTPFWRLFSKTMFLYQMLPQAPTERVPQEVLAAPISSFLGDIYSG